MNTADASYRVATFLVMLLFGVVGILSGESIYRREHLYLLDPETEWGRRTKITGRAARILGIVLMGIGVFFLLVSIAGVFLGTLITV